MLIAIDFDGTIVSHRYPFIGSPNQEVFRFIRKLKEKGHRWILWTCSSGERLDEAVAFLKMNGIEPDFVNENAPEYVEDFGRDSRKVFAHFYIDDRNPGGVKIPWEIVEY